MPLPRRPSDPPGLWDNQGRQEFHLSATAEVITVRERAGRRRQVGFHFCQAPTTVAEL